MARRALDTLIQDKKKTPLLVAPGTDNKQDKEPLLDSLGAGCRPRFQFHAAPAESAAGGAATQTATAAVQHQHE